MADTAVYDIDRVVWSRLEYRATKLLITASSQVEISVERADAARARWSTPSRGTPLLPAGDEVVRITLGSQLLGKRSDLDLWLDPSTGDAFQRSQLERGRKLRHNRHRSIRFTDIGVLSSTHRATEETVDRSYEQWNVTESFETYPLELPRGAGVSEPSGLFYLLTVAELEKPGDQTSIHVFSKGQVMRVTLAAEEWTELEVDYLRVESSVPEGKRLEERRRVLRIRLHGQPLVDHDSGVDFEFLGLEGDVEVFLEPEGRFPVQISGDIKRAGRGHIRLQRVVMR